MDTSPAIVDLHCDLLAYLVWGTDRTAHDRASRCSLPQLRAGNVRLQVLADFVITGAGSTEMGMAQAEAFARLSDARPQEVRAVRGDEAAASLLDPDAPISVLFAIENASAFCEEGEPLDVGLARLETIERLTGGVLYVTTTWNGENRFGGGNVTTVGLKDDGRRLLDTLATRGIAVDLSHASPWLAEGVLEHDARHELGLGLLASHSCFRHFVDLPRNLPDDVARTIFARGGMVGLNFMKPFLGGEVPARFADQVRHAVSLGGTAAYGMGADFFCTDDMPAHLRASITGDSFFEGFGDASCYPQIFDHLGQESGLGIDTDALAHGNALAFLKACADRRRIVA